MKSLIMEPPLSSQEQQLCQMLMQLPAKFKYRYHDAAAQELLSNLFWCMAAGSADYLNLFFPNGGGPHRAGGTLKLREAQGAVDGAEYTEAARGSACGHIFRAGEATYSCRTCATDETCVLCSKCYDSTDHTGHMVRIAVSPGNSGCCDCGDPEAWRIPMFCTIHSNWDGEVPKGKGKEAGLPDDLVASIKMTIGRVFDFICDVISCSPEQLRQSKSVESIEQDERMSRLSSVYGGGDVGPPDEYSVLLWNDEKHTVADVQEQVARACRTTKAEGLSRAYETDAIGRSILKHSKSVEQLLEVAKILENIKVTVTIRSSRDTFREEMCGTLIDWLSDIAGCWVGSDQQILRYAVCEEMLKPWRRGSPGSHAIVGENGIDDEALLEPGADEERGFVFVNGRLLPIAAQIQIVRQAVQMAETAAGEADDDDDDEEMEAGDRTPSSGDIYDDDDDDDVMMVDAGVQASTDVAADGWRPGMDQSLEEDEATMAGYPPPPPPPPTGRRGARERDLTPSDSDTAEPLIAPTVYAKANLEIPKTPGNLKDDKTPPPNPGKYWLGVPAGYIERENVPVAEDLFQRVRLDWLILFDLRMWKKVRNDLRSLYISTVVSIPEFKRILGLRFAGLYTTLAQLYLIGDREPDHSIINISVQMITTPSISAEIVERGNFLSSLMAILYTFLTTRQVGHPWDVSSNAILAFDSGTVTSRRVYHFFQDLRHLFVSIHVQERLRAEDRYTMQFLDLIKLHQGICPNIRAVGEHVEYETDSWIGASLITREVNKLCRQFSEAFRTFQDQDLPDVSRAIRLAAKAVIVHSTGAERHRFGQAEIKDEVKFKRLTDFEFDQEGAHYDVVKFVVEEQWISFHHALHYTLSWLIECGKGLERDQLRNIMRFTTQELKGRPRSMGRKAMPRRDYSPEDYLMAAFDYPLRVCAWLAQMKANMWVRNGLSLRHQAAQYRNVNNRDVSHHRDILLLQTALVICDPSRVLASIIDRFGMERWVKGFFEQKATAQDDAQHLDVVEDMIHLLIVLVSERTSLVQTDSDKGSLMLSMRRDLVHVLCFKPLSFSEITNKVPDKYQEQEEFHEVLDSVSTYKPPESLTDVGTFELKPELVEEVDPYIAHFNKNQREESETAYRKWMAKKTRKPMDDIVFEPRLRTITSKAFTSLSDFTGTGMFAQLVYYSLLYTLVAGKLTPNVQFSRVETFLQVVLHLTLIAVSEDKSSEEKPADTSFILVALSKEGRSNFMPEAPSARTIVALLDMMSTNNDFKACHPKISLILKRMRQKRPRDFESAYARLGVPVDRISTASPANLGNVEEEKERKKKAALDRQARVMAQFQQQQKSFMENQGDIDWGIVEDEEDEELPPMEEQRSFWKYPSGTCILCQENTDDRRLYGTFGLLTESKILRQTDLQDGDFVREVANTPKSLDRSAEAIRPFGIAHENRRQVAKVNAAGETFTTERQVIAKGFPSDNCMSGPVSIGCGHIMHFSCFETYFDATLRRHQHQIARHHPEEIERLEFVCPLCKALGNAFLPIIWKGKEEAYPGALNASDSFNHFLDHQMSSAYYLLGAARPSDQVQSSFQRYTTTSMLNGLADRSSLLLTEVWEGSGSQSTSIGTPMSDAFNIPTPGSSSARSSTAPDNSGMMRELVKVYRRLRETLRVNRLESLHSPNDTDDLDNELCGSDTLARAVGFSISAVEIQQRGTDAEYGMTFLEKIPDQVLTHLRILTETVTSYIAVGGQRHGGDNIVEIEYRKDSERQHCQLFMAQYMGEETENSRRPADSYLPLLGIDPFLFLCEATFGMIPAQSFEIAHIVRLCYLAELVKIVYHMGRNMPGTTWITSLINRAGVVDPALENFAEFCLGVVQLDLGHRTRNGEVMDASVLAADALGANRGFDQDGLRSLDGYYSFVKKYALVFLRKCVVLLHVRYGVDFNSRVSPSPELDELERLTEMLRVPSFDAMCTSLTGLGPEYGWPQSTQRLVGGWVRHYFLYPVRHHLGRRPPSAVVSHPGIFELIGLSKNYDQLIEECTRRRCPTTGKDVTDPHICLLCGDVFCGQGICCLKEEKSIRGRRNPTRVGGAHQHMRR
jgi:E3 ubiquitin-protein ligase UBR1